MLKKFVSYFEADRLGVRAGKVRVGTVTFNNPVIPLNKTDSKIEVKR